MTPMLRLPFLSLLLLALFQSALGADCEPCGDSQYQITTPSATFDAGVERLSCKDLITFSGDRRQGTDVCYLIVNYALQHCNCLDGSGNAAPDLPYYDETAPCNICGGDNGSDLWTTDPTLAEVSVPTSLGISVKCEFLFQTGLQGAFLPSQCPSVQQATRVACGCALYDSNGNTVSGAFGFTKAWLAVTILEVVALFVIW